MITLALKPGHDGAIAALEEDRLLFSLEAEKDSFPRHVAVTPDVLLAAFEQLGGVPDVLAIGGWLKSRDLGKPNLGAGYQGQQRLFRETTVMGKKATMFSSTHERSHIAMALAMAPQKAPRSAVLCWEGNLGRFYLMDEQWN